MEDLYYYKERCSDLEAELAEAKKTIAKLNGRLYDVKKAVLMRSATDTNATLNAIAWLAYDWKD